MKSLVFLSSDTPHHRYFLNKLHGQGYHFSHVFFETEHVEPCFPVGPLFEKEEEEFEQEHFFQDISSDISHLEITEVKTLNEKSAIKDLQELNADLGIVFGTGKLHTDVTSCFKNGLLNVHRGIAEKYRGLDSDLWTIYHADYKNLGVTIHLVEPRLDTGDIVKQAVMPLKAGMKIHQIRFYTTLIATRLIEDALDDYFSDELETTPLSKLGRYYSFMPLDLKKLVTKKFNRYCSRLSEVAEDGQSRTTNS